MGLDTIAQNVSAGYVHATEAINLHVRRIVIYVIAFILLDKMVLLAEEHPDPVSAITSKENISNNPNLRLAYKTQHYNAYDICLSYSDD